jgi:alginate O-acetyltransferase complex protein AlgI
LPDSAGKIEMAFNTFQYLGFYLLVFATAWLLSGSLKARLWFLLGASLYFYTSTNGWQVFLILGTTTIDYLVCRRLERIDDEGPRRRLVAVSVISNLGVLAWFKYSNLLGNSLAQLAALIGFKLDWVALNVMLPVGISFYTFEALSYTIDVYRRKIPAERSWNRLAFLVTFFPHLIAGPIVRAADFLPQTRQPPRLTKHDLQWAIFKIAGGLIKKLVLADGLAPLADAAFVHPTAAGTVRVWLGVYAFAFQIFFDFSGYTDIALGCAKLLGFQLPENFRRPYAATSIGDFWHRWHMTLSTWLRDYLYIPLGGNRMKTRWGVYRNLMLTMLLGGLWHGAAWTFIFWGGIHGFYLTIERALGIGHRARTKPAWLAVLQSILVFQLVLLTWIPFRARGLREMGQVFGVMFSAMPGSPLNSGETIAALIILGAWIWQLAGERLGAPDAVLKMAAPARKLAYAFVASAALVAATVYFLGTAVPPTTFIYFRF